MKKYIKQIGYLLISLRPKQHIKNIILFVPLVFSSLLLNIDSVEKASIIFILFSLFAGTTYIINDYKDREKDKNHAKKKDRPLASGKLNPNFALIGAIIIGLGSLYFSYSVGGVIITILFLVYLLNTIIYTFFLKEFEILDVFSIAIGFVVRGLIGTFIIDTKLSPRLLIMLFFGALRLGFLKRYQEVKAGGNTRNNITKYNEHFLEQIISMITTIILMGYSLYTFSSTQPEIMILTLPLIVFGIIRYYYNIFFLKKYEESIENIVLRDKRILGDIILYIVITLLIVIKG